MKTRLVLSALAVSGVIFSFSTAAQAVTVQFNSTLAFTDTGPKLSFVSSGLNATLTVGVPDVISKPFKAVTVRVSGEVRCVRYRPISHSPCLLRQDRRRTLEQLLAAR